MHRQHFILPKVPKSKIMLAFNYIFDFTHKPYFHEMWCLRQVVA